MLEVAWRRGRASSGKQVTSGLDHSPGGIRVQPAHLLHFARFALIFTRPHQVQPRTLTHSCPLIGRPFSRRTDASNSDQQRSASVRRFFFNTHAGMPPQMEAGGGMLSGRRQAHGKPPPLAIFRTDPLMMTCPQPSCSKRQDPVQLARMQAVLHASP